MLILNVRVNRGLLILLLKGGQTVEGSVAEQSVCSYAFRYKRNDVVIQTC